MPMNTDDGLEDIKWIRGLGGRGCPRRPTLFSQPEKGLPGIFLPSERDRSFFVVSFRHTSAQMCFYQTLGRRPLHITGRRVNAVT